MTSVANVVVRAVMMIAVRVVMTSVVSVVGRAVMMIAARAASVTRTKLPKMPRSSVEPRCSPGRAHANTARRSRLRLARIVKSEWLMRVQFVRDASKRVRRVVGNPNEDVHTATVSGPARLGIRIVSCSRRIPR